MKELTRTYSDLLQDKRVRGEQNRYEAFSRQRNTVLSKYRKIYQAYTDLQAGLSRAKQFYEEMKDTVDSLKKNVDSFVENRRSEGGQLLSAIEKAKGNGADREQARLRDMMERMSVSPSSGSSQSPVPDQRGHRPPPLQQTSYSQNPGNMYNPARSPPITPGYGQQANGTGYQSYTPTTSAFGQQQQREPYNPNAYGHMSPPAHQQYFSPPPTSTQQAGHPSTTAWSQHQQHGSFSSAQGLPQGWQPPPPPPGPPPPQQQQDYGAISAMGGGYPSGPGGYAADPRRSQGQGQTQGSGGGGGDPWAGLSAWK